VCLLSIEADVSGFEKIIDNRGQGLIAKLYPLLRLGVTRAAALAGDVDKTSPRESRRWTAGCE